MLAIDPALVAAFRHQGTACTALGSPTWGTLCGALADDLEVGGPAARVMAHWDGDGDPMDQAVPLRVLGTAHRLALLDRAPAFADHLPSCGGEAGHPGAWSALSELLEDQPGAFVDDLPRPVQTNEVGRSAALLPALGLVAAGRPVRLLEIGAAAGLNLRLDQYDYRLGDTVVPGRPPTLVPDWTGGPPPVGPVHVVARSGCDLHPIDVTTTEGAARAESYVWPDMGERFARMRAAVATSATVPVRLDAASASAWLDAELVPSPGVLTVVLHSVMWQYVAPAEQVAIEGLLEERGAAATSDAPLARVCLEPVLVSPEKWRFEIRVTRWPGGHEAVVGRAHPHGAWVVWDPPGEV